MQQTNETNTQVLAHLQELAQLYFTEIIRINHLMPGNYSARNIMTENYKEPDDKKFDEDITIECGAFKMKINYRKIFVALARWETTMQVPSKQRATFAVGSVEEKNIKVLTVETDIYSETLEKKTVEKRMRLQRICGNWWVPKKNLKNDLIDLYYNLNGVFFRPCNISSHEITPENRATLIAKLEEYDKILIDRLLSENVQSQPYFVEVCRRAKVGNYTQMEPTPETPQTAECTPKDDKSDTKHAKAITMLNAKLAKLHNEACKYDGRYWLSRKLYFSNANQVFKAHSYCIKRLLALI